ncbi:MAG TPA: hypothetical protein VFQ53_31325 [Kofleriaceae bacterium]|nr:hypothetical protein [Kofleriaceae bacterium]
MAPYRTAARSANHAPRDVMADAHDDHVLGALLLVIGGFRVASALAEHEAFGAEPTIALVMVALALALLLRRSRRRHGCSTSHFSR